MNANFGKYEYQDIKTGWIILRNGEPMKVHYGSREEAENGLRSHLTQQLERMLLRI